MQKARGGAHHQISERKQEPHPLQKMRLALAALWRNCFHRLPVCIEMRVPPYISTPPRRGHYAGVDCNQPPLGMGEEESYKFILLYCDPGANFHLVITESHTTIGKLDKPQQINAKEALKSDCS